LLRVVFLAAVALFAWLGLRGRWDEVGDAVSDVSLAGLASSLALVGIGLFATGLLWLRLMARLDARLPLVPGLSMFFVGQLGKYIPGSVWSIGAQAEQARRRDVPARVTVAAGLLFLGYHVATAAILGAAVLASGELDSRWPNWLSWIAIVVAAIGLVPAVVRELGRRIGGRDARIGWADTVVAVALMAVAWTAYSTALVLLSPGIPWDDLTALGGAFAVGYAVGVVIVLAPAGVGARETVFVVLLSPLTGVTAATALALLARVVHTVADGLMAAGWWLASRTQGVRSSTASEPRSTCDPQ
jgi:uncharacterized membrane protein YbhN (UPF0104 family)